MVSVSAYWCLRVPTGVSSAKWYLRCLMVSQVPNGVSGAYWCLRVPTGVCGCLLVSDGVSGANNGVSGRAVRLLE